MTTIAALAVAASLALTAFGTRASVGGPMSDLLFSLLIIAIVSIHVAWTKRLGPIGWLASILAAMIGGCVALMAFGVAMEAALSRAHFEGRLIDSNLSYGVSAAMTGFTLVGAWLPAELVSRFRLSR